MADEVKIPIVTTADTTGAKAVSSALSEVNSQAAKATGVTTEQTKTTKNLTVASKQAEKGLLDQGEAIGQAAAGGRVLTEVSRGNIGALLQLGSVLKATRAALTSTLGVVGLLLAGVSAAITTIRSRMAEKTENNLKAEAEKTEVAFTAARAAAEKLNEQKTDAFQARLKAIDDAARLAVDRVQRLVDIAAKIDDVEKATRFAAIDADQSLSDEEKLNAKAEINRDFASRAESRTRQVEDAQLAAAQTRFDDTLRATAGARRTATAARSRASAASGASLLDLMRPLERQLADAQAANPGANVRIPALEDLQSRFREATQSDAGKQRASIAAAEAAAREADLKAAQQRETAAKQALRELEQRISDERDGREQLATLQARHDKRQYNLELQVARAADEARPRRPGVPRDPYVPTPTVTNTGDTLPPPAIGQAERDRAAAVGNVAGGLASGIVNDLTVGEGLRTLAAQTASAAKALETDQSAATIAKAVELLEGLANAVAVSRAERAKDIAATAARLAKIEGSLKALGR